MRPMTRSLPGRQARRPVSRPHWPTSIAVAILLVAVLFAAFGTYLAQEEFLGRVALTLLDVSEFGAFAASDRILILAPHPDDEVLGTGGLIQQALASGADVRVVFLTLGDNNLASFATYAKRPMLVPSQVQNMGETRHKEALAALEVLGIMPESVAFLCYPDAGTLRIWESFWADGSALWSRWIRTSHVPYGLAVSTGASYTGGSVLADLEQAITAYQPSMVIVGHPDDANPDHQALWLFAQAALFDLGPPYDAIPLWSYLVHFGTWTKLRQQPQSRYLFPPEALQQGNTSWATLLLEEEQMALKWAALGKHATQLSLRKSYLESFVRPNELFAQVTPGQLSTSLFEWKGVEFRPFFGSPKASLLKRFAPGLYLNQFDLIEEGDSILISVATERRLGTRQKLVVWLYPQQRSAAFAQAPKIQIVLDRAGLLSAQDLRDGSQRNVVFEPEDGRMVVRVSRATLDEPDALFLAASMRSNGVTLDHTGWRLVYLEPKDEQLLFQDPQGSVLHAWEGQEGYPDGDQAVSGE